MDLETLKKLAGASLESEEGETSEVLPDEDDRYHATFEYESGAFYDGQWKMYDGRAKKDGHGCEFFSSGDVYEGQFVEGKWSGKGRLQYKSGNFYEGEFANNKLEGNGVFTAMNGTVFTGVWKADKAEGPCASQYADGITEVSMYEDDRPVGEGVRWSADGETARRIEDGKFVESISFDDARRLVRARGLPKGEWKGLGTGTGPRPTWADTPPEDWTRPVDDPPFVPSQPSPPAPPQPPAEFVQLEPDPNISADGPRSPSQWEKF